MNEKREEYPESLIQELTEQDEIFGAIADCASSYEHNLLASSLFGVFPTQVNWTSYSKFCCRWKWRIWQDQLIYSEEILL